MKHLSTISVLGVACLIASCNNCGAPASSNDAGTDAGVDGGTDGGTDAGPLACADRNVYKNLYWGDLHTHTQYSADAYAFGTRNSPVDAYAFARGEARPVAAADPAGSPGMSQLKPGYELDFDAITDHSEWLAITYGCGLNLDGGPFDPASPFVGSGACSVLQGSTAADNFGPSITAQLSLCDGGAETGGVAGCLSTVQSAWQKEQEAAAIANDPCHFTSLVAYEFTYGVAGATLHRNVVFGSDQVPAVPFDSFDYRSPVELWTALDNQCLPDAGCDVIVIPHNSNLSKGLAFDVPDWDAGALAQMNKYQRLVEIHQHKGNSECFWAFDGGGNALDPLCNFEQRVRGGPGDVPGNFVRVGLTRGLALRAQTGINPFQMGIVGATDDHNGLPGNVAEDTWPGHFAQGDDTAAKRLATAGTIYNNPGGVTGVWAEQNTRSSIFAALKRRETFATSGPRLAIRMYQTWDATDYCSGALPDGGSAPFPNNIIESGGLPMGSDIPLPPPAGSAGPYLTVNAAKDQVDLAEIDIIRANGFGAEELIRFTGFTNPALACIHWHDTAYNPAVPTYYYARVLQAPTWRWSHYDCLEDAGYNPLGCAPDGGLDIQIQERGWTSPIWSQP